MEIPEESRMIITVTLIIIAAIIIIAIIVMLDRKEESKKDRNIYQEPINQYYYPYHKKEILTQNEYNFYKKLKTVTDQFDLQILTKIRLADLVEVDKGLQSKQWGMYFGKIKAKHIDFAIADDMKVVALIELDDYTHRRANRKERDVFINDVLNQTGYVLIRTYGDTEQIQQFLESRDNYISVYREYEKM